LLFACSSHDTPSDWTESFGYSYEQVYAIEIGDFGYPFVPVTIGDGTVTLPFDTGNMVGISLNTPLFDHFGLTETGTWNRLSGSGEVVATLRVGQTQEVTILGHDLGQRRIYEFDDKKLPGLVGPDFLEGGHFTLDYKTRRIGAAFTPLPDSIPGYRAVSLVRSSRYPTLILAHGGVEDRRVLIEIDTGKSRSVVNPGLAAELGLERNERGVRIERLGIGGLSFEVPSAKESDQTAIDTGVPEPILAGVGSDILSRFVWTVDYNAGVLWIPVSP
jgi:hypothetical protein